MDGHMQYNSNVNVKEIVEGGWGWGFSGGEGLTGCTRSLSQDQNQAYERWIAQMN